MEKNNESSTALYPKIQYEKPEPSLKVAETFGFKGAIHIKPNYPKSINDWSGYYVGETKEQCEGYLTEEKSGEAFLLEVRPTKNIPVLKFESKWLANSTVKSEDKATAIKKFLLDEKIISKNELEEPLMELLGRKGYVYKGLEHEDLVTEGCWEIVLPCKMVKDGLFEVRKIANFTIKNYEIERANHNLENEEWQSLSYEIPSENHNLDNAESQISQDETPSENHNLGNAESQILSDDTPSISMSPNEHSQTDERIGNIKV